MNNDKNTIHNQKHLTFSDRTYIEQELLQNSTFRYIGNVLHKDPSTISKEIRKHVKMIDGKRASGHCIKCKHYTSCEIRGYDSVVSECKHSSYCKNICKRCWRERPPQFCPIYMSFVCDKPLHAPYACNSCVTEKDCPLSHPVYAAKTAQIVYEKTLVKSRAGINMTPDEIPVCRRTLYNYLDQRIFQARNIDLPRRVRYKKVADTINANIPGYT